MIPLKVQNKSPVTNLKEIETCEVSDKKFKIKILRNFSELRKYTDT